MVKSTGTARYTKLRKILIDSRKAAGLTQQQLARLLGRPQSYVSKFETGERRLDIVEFVAICEALRRDAFDCLREVLRNGSSRRRGVSR